MIFRGLLNRYVEKRSDREYHFRLPRASSLISNLLHTLSTHYQYVHRCGRAGRNKVSGRAGDDKTKQISDATVYSFFNRELALMASDVVDLLRSCNAWVDPNLVALVPGGIKQGEGASKRKRRKRDKNKSEGPNTADINPPNAKKKNKSIGDDIGVMEELEDEFPDLVPNRIVLKRASHVTYSDSEDDDLLKDSLI